MVNILLKLIFQTIRFIARSCLLSFVFFCIRKQAKNRSEEYYLKKPLISSLLNCKYKNIRHLKIKMRQHSTFHLR